MAPDEALSRTVGGYVVVLFGASADGYCTLDRCPLGTADWFPTRDAAGDYCDTLPSGFEPHILAVQEA